MTNEDTYNPWAAPKASLAREVEPATPAKSAVKGVETTAALLEFVINRKALAKHEFPPVVGHTDFTKPMHCAPPLPKIEKTWRDRFRNPALPAPVIFAWDTNEKMNIEEMEAYGAGKFYDINRIKGFQWESINLEALKPQKMKNEDIASLRKVTERLKEYLFSIKHEVNALRQQGKKDEYLLSEKCSSIDQLLDTLVSAVDKTYKPIQTPFKDTELLNLRESTLHNYAKSVPYHLRPYLRNLSGELPSKLLKAGDALLHEVETNRELFADAAHHALYQQAERSIQAQAWQEAEKPRQGWLR